jgi:hypothetical protein
VVVMLNFNLFRDSTYLNIIVWFVTPLPNGQPTVFILNTVNKKSSGSSSIIPIVIIIYQVSEDVS